MILKEGRPYSSELITPDNIVVYDLAISISAGGTPIGDPATLTGKVERVLDNQAEPVQGNWWPLSINPMVYGQ